MIAEKATNARPGFARILLDWDRNHNHRPMPWKGEKDPYRIWLSEIILQQTRVEQGWDYYHQFIETFPDIISLANAPEKDVFKLWEGLGYYSRCRNLIATARFIARERDGVFPDNYDDILRLKGVGPYTAAAISSFAFNLPYAVVDGNVFRVLSRITGDATPVDSTEGKQRFSKLATEWLDKDQPGLYNQAMMDFGAVICKPKSPKCMECPFRNTCMAYREDRIDELPVKAKKLSPRKRWFYYIIMEHDGYVAIRKRVEKDIWKDLYEFPLVESERQAAPTRIIESIKERKWLDEFVSNPEFSVPYKQQLTHQSIAGRFVTIRILRRPSFSNDWLWIKREAITDYPFPGYINQYLRQEKAVSP